MPIFLALATRLRLPPWLLAGLLMVLSILAAVFGLRLWLRGHDAAVVDVHEIAVALEVQTGGRAADQAMAARRVDDDASIRNKRKEFDNATIHIAQARLSARQRIDACEQLRAQAEPAAVLASAGCL